MLGVSQSRGLKLFGGEIIFKEFQLLIPKRHGRTDGQTDGRLTVASLRSALASRGKNRTKFRPNGKITQSVAKTDSLNESFYHCINRSYCNYCYTV